jgi:hypothetical protein
MNTLFLDRMGQIITTRVPMVWARDDGGRLVGRGSRTT